MATVSKNFLLGKDLYFDPGCIGFKTEDFSAGMEQFYDFGLLSVLVTGSTLLSGEYILSATNNYNSTFDLVRSDFEYTFRSNFNDLLYEWQKWTLIQGSNQIGVCTDEISQFDIYGSPFFTPNGWVLNDGTFLSLTFKLSTQYVDNDWVPALTSLALNRNWLIDTFDAYDYTWYPEAFKNKRYELAENLVAIINGRSSNKIQFYSDLYNLLSNSFSSVTAMTGIYFTVEHSGTMQLDTVSNTCSSVNMSTNFYVY